MKVCVGGILVGPLGESSLVLFLFYKAGETLAFFSFWQSLRMRISYKSRHGEPMENLPIKGWPLDVVPLLEDLISEFIEPWRVDEFYIGRTTSVSAAQSRHACDEIFALYETSSAENAIEVEDSLIQTFLSHSKCNNDADHGGGGASDQYVNYVYLAIWYRR